MMSIAQGCVCWFILSWEGLLNTCPKVSHLEDTEIVRLKAADGIIV
jgi:hypothetical protein